MITFKAVTPQEKWIKSVFNSKAQLIRESGLTRPTIDKLCIDIWLFYKYVPLFSTISNQSKESIIRKVSN